ncbi:hypothetical protein D3C81_176670 [compost metagenome]
MSTVSEMREHLIGKMGFVYRCNDLAHQIGHFNAVEVCGNEINNRLKLGYDPKMIMLVAYLHDMFAWSRVNHHIMSWQYVLTSDMDLLCTLTGPERKLVAYGCKEHRASFGGKFTSAFSELMNSADRELPGNVPAMLERAIQYRVDNLGWTDNEESRLAVRDDAVAHIKEKFGDGGYARYPEMYLRCFAAELEQQRLDIAKL